MGHHCEPFAHFSISEYKAKHKMICAEAVKPEEILWKPRENPSQTEKPARNLEILQSEVFPGYPRESAAQKVIPNKNAAGASHPSRIVRGPSDSPRPPLTRRDDASGPTALPRECRICQSWLHSRSCDHKAQPLRGPAAHSHSRSGIGEEAATPGQPVRVRTRFQYVPRRFTLENHRLLQALPQSSGKLRKLSRFRCTHSQSEPRRSQ